MWVSSTIEDGCFTRGPRVQGGMAPASADFAGPRGSSQNERRRARGNDASSHKALGRTWSRSNRSRLFTRTAGRAGAAGATIYALQHSSVVRQLLAGVPIRAVAANHDTSVAMLERKYSRYIAEHADAMTPRRTAGGSTR